MKCRYILRDMASVRGCIVTYGSDLTFSLVYVPRLGCHPLIGQLQ